MLVSHTAQPDLLTLPAVRENVKCCSHFGKQFFLGRLNTHIPYKPTIQLLGVYAREVKVYIQRNISAQIRMNVTAVSLVIIAQTENSPNAHQQVIGTPVQ